VRVAEVLPCLCFCLCAESAQAFASLATTGLSPIQCAGAKQGVNLTPLQTWTRFSLAVGTVVVSGYTVAPQVTSNSNQNQAAEHDRVALSQVFPRLNGAQLKATIVEVTYGPGGSSPPHSHPCPVLVYVLSGELRTQIKDKPAKTHKAGETFYEAPNGVHLISANASDRAPVKFLAYFVCDRDTPLIVPPPDNPLSGAKP
jgi:quercetin dioxygenase-like cupin family protein